ncbi:synaptophysin-like isoform X2 [Littorina saxatilis]|uniref:MARVEL domain-containing protein n=1 Tax=Littorina saxatilis TaxID=31220 RepID=A0AAN9GBY5_9CAEN
MEAAGQIASNFNAGVFKEPRGFLKLIQFVLSIFAFATTTSFTSSSTFNVKCNETYSASITFEYGYPFDLESVCVKSPACNKTNPQDVCLLAGAQSSSQFYVFVGVIVMLYCMAALVLYIFFDELYRKNNRIIVGDFVVSIVLTLLWLISASAWASGLSDVKEYTDPAEGGFFDNGSFFPECKDASKTGSCTVVNVGNYGSLNASVIFGFLNMMVWVGNLWFLYKETPWFKVQSKPPAGTPGESTGAANVY